MAKYLEVVNERDFIEVWRDGKYGDFLVDAYRKVCGGLRHFIYRYKNLRLEQIDRTLDKAFFSQRPFQLGQLCDGSGDACCHALFYHFCQSNGLDAAALYHQAYANYDGSNYQVQDYEAILKLANWQGVAYPVAWTKEAYEGLVYSLLDINNRSLVRVLEQTVEHSTLFLEHQIREQIKQLSF